MANWVRVGQDTGEIRKEIDPERMGEQLYGTLTGLNHQWLVDPTLDLERAYQEMKRNIHQLLRNAAA